MSSAAQIWHDLIDKVEEAILPVKHLFNEHEPALASAISDLRQQADAEAGHLIGDAETAGTTLLGQAEAAAAPLADEAKSDAGDLAHTAQTDAEQVLSGAAPAPPTADSGQNAPATPETAA